MSQLADFCSPDRAWIHCRYPDLVVARKVAWTPQASAAVDPAQHMQLGLHGDYLSCCNPPFNLRGSRMNLMLVRPCEAAKDRQRPALPGRVTALTAFRCMGMLAVVLTSLTAAAARAEVPVRSGWTLQFADDFSGPHGQLPSSANWQFDLGHGYPGAGANWVPMRSKPIPRDRKT